MARDPAQTGTRAVESDTGESSIPQAPIADPDVLTSVSGLDPREGGLRIKTARGLLINTAFRFGVAGIGLLRQVGVAAFVSASVYGLWGLLITTLITLAFLKRVGIADKYIQQREEDQVVAFQKAFTLQLVYTLLLVAVIATAIPIYAFGIYGRPEILLPGLVLSLSLIATSFQMPSWIFYRRMDYFRQRSIEVVDPIVTTLATVALLIAGLELWGLVIGVLIGSVAGAVVALVANPYPLRLRLDRGAVREYYSFSWPLFVNGIGGLLMVQGTVILANAALGLAAVGAIGLAANFARFSYSVEQLINTTMYPAVSAVQERLDLLLEVFVKSNRLALMWALPFGIGLTLFAPDLVGLVLGPSWDDALGLMQIAGLTLGFGTIAFSWATFYKARGRTRPIAVSGILSVAVFAAVTAPLMLTVGVIGYAIGMAAAMAVQLVLRGYFLARLFPGFNLMVHALRAVAPVVPAVLVVLLMRLVEDGGTREPAAAVAELVVYVLVVAATTYAAERELIREALGYLRGAVRKDSAAQAPPQPGAVTS